MALQGMDPAVIRDVAAKLDAQAGRLGAAITALQGTVSRAQHAWRGPDQDSFDSSWSARHQPALAAAHSSLTGMVALLRKQAAEQDTTSNDLTGTPGSARAVVAGPATAGPLLPGPVLPGPMLPIVGPPAAVPDPLKNPEVRAALAGLGRPATPDQLNALTRALNDLPPDQRQVLVNDLISSGQLGELRGSLIIDSIGIFGPTISNPDRLALYSALLSAASPAAIIALNGSIPGMSPSLDNVGSWQRDKYGNPEYRPVNGALLDGDGADPDDVSQGQIGDCYFLSSLIATATADPGFVANHVQDNGNGTTTVTLYQNGEAVPVTVTNTVPQQDGSNIGVVSKGGTWPELYEKAYAQYRGGYGTIDQGGYGRDGLSAITGLAVHTTSEQTGWTNHIPLFGTSPKAPSVDVNQIQTLLNSHHAITVGTNQNSGNTDDSIGSDVRHSALIENHEYVVQSVNSDGTVTLRNPWDPGDTPRLPWSTIEKQSQEVVWTETRP